MSHQVGQLWHRQPPLSSNLSGIKTSVTSANINVCWTLNTFEPFKSAESKRCHLKGHFFFFSSGSPGLKKPVRSELVILQSLSSTFSTLLLTKYFSPKFSEDKKKNVFHWDKGAYSQVWCYVFWERRDKWRKDKVLLTDLGCFPPL